MLKILGQSKPGAGSTTTLYQAGGGKSAVVSSLICCNTNAGVADSIVVYQVLAAGTPSASNTIFKANLAPDDSYVIIAGLALAAGEKISVVSTSGHVAFTASGDES